MADDKAKLWCFDVDDTITAAPEQYARLTAALKAYGDQVAIVTGHGPKDTRRSLLDQLGVTYDEIVIVDPKDDGAGKAKALKKLDAFMLFDNQVAFGPEVIKVCPVAFQYSEPPGDKDAKKNAKKAAKSLKRDVRLVDGPLQGQTCDWYGLAEIVCVDGHLYRVQADRATAMHETRIPDSYETGK